MIAAGASLAALAKSEPWMRELAHSDPRGVFLRGVFLRARTLLRYVLSSPAAIPLIIP